MISCPLLTRVALGFLASTLCSLFGLSWHIENLWSGFTNSSFQHSYLTVQYLYQKFGSCLHTLAFSSDESQILALVPFLSMSLCWSILLVRFVAHCTGWLFKKKLLAFTPSTKINRLSLQLVMWFIFNLKNNKIRK